jgi:tryptophan synthase alpha chain
VLAGFGIRSRRQVAAVARFVDGVVVGSALIEVIESGEDPGEFLRGLRISEVPA